MKLEDRMLRSVKLRAGNIVLRSELSGLGSASQVSEALKSLQKKGVLVRIGTGVYAKTRVSSITGAVVPAGSLETLAVETLKKLNVTPGESRAAVQYNSGRTTQLPGQFVAHTGKKRMSRKIAVGGRILAYESDHR
jgi:hypothetical protein